MQKMGLGQADTSLRTFTGASRNLRQGLEFNQLRGQKMRKTALVALAASACLALFPAIYAVADTNDAARLFTREIPKDQRVQQALSRLTFGARPGDVAAVNAMGLKQWLDLQLHPEQITEN